MYIQEIRDSGVAGYQYIEVKEDLAANVLYGNSTVVHMASDQIPADVSVSIEFLHSIDTHSSAPGTIWGIKQFG